MSTKWRVKYKIDGCDLLHGVTVEARDELEATMEAIKDAHERNGDNLTIVAIKELVRVEEDEVEEKSAM